MEPKQYIALSILMFAAVFGSGFLIYTLRRLDKQDESGQSDLGTHHGPETDEH